MKKFFTWNAMLIKVASIPDPPVTSGVKKKSFTGPANSSSWESAPTPVSPIFGLRILISFCIPIDDVETLISGAAKTSKEEKKKRTERIIVIRNFI